MAYSTSSYDQQKILNLIYSGEYANDLLVLEILKHVEIEESLFYPLAGIILSSFKESVKSGVFDFIKPFLPEAHVNFFKLYTSSYFFNWLDHDWVILKNHFSNQEIVALSYTNFRRDGLGIESFLIHDDGSHPEREIIFQALLKMKIIGPRNIQIYGLFPDEMDEYVQLRFSQKPAEGFDSLHFTNLRSHYISEKLLTEKFIRLNYSLPILDEFPDYLLQLKGLKSMVLTIGKNTKIPKDWSQMTELTQIHFQGSKHVFNDFDFLDTIPNVCHLVGMQGHFSPHPDFILTSKKFPVMLNKFASTEGYTLNEKGDISDQNMFFVFKLGRALFKSDFSFEKKQYYFKKIIALANLQEVLSFPIEELKELLNVDADDLQKVIRWFFIAKNESTDWNNFN